jgi:hypothetical protein
VRRGQDVGAPAVMLSPLSPLYLVTMVLELALVVENLPGRLATVSSAIMLVMISQRVPVASCKLEMSSRIALEVACSIRFSMPVNDTRCCPTRSASPVLCTVERR